MSFFAVLFALLLEQMKPFPGGHRVHDVVTGWFGVITRNFDAGRPHHAAVVWLAAVAVPTLGGSVDMKLPAGARAGQKLRLRGRGLPGSPPGDQFVLLKIVLPPDSPGARQLFEQMKREVPFDPRADLGQ